MYPVLLSLGNLQISSFGLLLALGIFVGSFTVWRIARGYEIDSEKILDLCFLTIGFGFIVARLVFVLMNLPSFDSFPKIFFINTYPGLSFWGGFGGGLIALSWLSRKAKTSALQIGDFAMVGFLLGSFFAEAGCLLGGCGIGVESNLFLAVSQVGVIGKRLPIQLFEAIAFLISFFIFWKASLKFHLEGSILAKGLILVGLIKIVATFFKAQVQLIKLGNFNLNLDLILAAVFLLIGLRIYYSVYRKTPIDDLKSTWRFFSDRKTQSKEVAKFTRWCYNHWVNFWISLGKGKKKLFKALHIKPNPDNF